MRAYGLWGTLGGILVRKILHICSGLPRYLGRVQHGDQHLMYVTKGRFTFTLESRCLAQPYCCVTSSTKFVYNLVPLRWLDLYAAYYAALQRGCVLRYLIRIYPYPSMAFVVWSSKRSACSK